MTDEKEVEMDKNRDRTNLTAEVLLDMFNNINNNLEFTTETYSNFDDARLPTLDTSVWIGDEGRLMFSFFKKV